MSHNNYNCEYNKVCGIMLILLGIGIIPNSLKLLQPEGKSSGFDSEALLSSGFELFSNMEGFIFFSLLSSAFFLFFKAYKLLKD